MDLRGPASIDRAGTSVRRRPREWNSNDAESARSRTATWADRGDSGMIRGQDTRDDPASRSWARGGGETSLLYYHLAVPEACVREIRVDPTHFDVVTRDVVLVAQLESTFALCLYAAVLESGALIHLRLGPPGRGQE